MRLRTSHTTCIGTFSPCWISNTPTGFALFHLLRTSTDEPGKEYGTLANNDFFDDGATQASFLFEVDGVQIGHFSEVSGLQVEVGVETLEEGGENGFVHKFPGRMTWPNVVFKRGLTKSNSLFAWLNHSSGEGFAGKGNKLKRSTAAVTLVSGKGTRLRSWEFEGAFPVRWSGPTFAAGSTDGATDELEIAHHGFVARKP